MHDIDRHTIGNSAELFSGPAVYWAIGRKTSVIVF